MQVEEYEINGFAIDKFNQHGLESGKKQGVCPLCSHDRKPKNQKLKCASYDWERGLGTCHNCNTTFQLHTYNRKGSNEKEYVRPAMTQYLPVVDNFKLYKGAEKIFYNINSVVGYDNCVITEGEMDVLALHEAGIKNAISVPNGATLSHNNLDYLDNCIDYFDDKTKIILALDTDDPGLALRAELVRRLGAETCYLVDFEDCKDANEYLIKYGKDKLKQVIDKARSYPLENVTTFKDIEGEVKDFVKNGFKPGYQVGLSNFDEIFSTYTSQFITVTGIPSSGKSDFVDQMVVGYNRNYAWKTAFASPENAPTYLHAHKLMRKTWQGMPSSKDIHGEKWNRIANHVNDNYFFIDMERYTLESVLRKGAELVKRKGIKCLVIDPFNKVRDKNASSLDVNTYTMEYLTKIENFAKKFDVLVFIVAHPTKMYKTNDGKIEEPNMYNIKGGGEWYDASYHGILVHRDYDAQTVKAKVLKVKFQNLGENGAEAHFKWEPKSGSFIPQVVDKIKNEPMPWE